MCVSVIIPSYNHYKYVVQAIESVLSQSWPNIDLIVIDDGSRDGSPEVIQRLWQERGGFRFISRENQGLIKTLNEGLALAKGEFICELASDDYLPLDSLERRTNFLTKNPECVAVFADGILIFDENRTEQTFLDERRRKMLGAADPIPEMLQGALPVFSTGLFRTEILRKIGGFDEEDFRFYEDLDTPIRLALAGRFGFIDAPVICRRQHETNISTSTSHIRVEKVFWYAKLLRMSGMVPYKAIVQKQLRRSVLKLMQVLSRQKKELNERELTALRMGWQYAWHDPRILFYLLKLRVPVA